jgi:hypothetical protein
LKRALPALGCEMNKKNSLHYELYGSSARGEKKGYWRWAIFAGQEKKPLLVGSFYGPLADAKEHADAAISRLKERAQKPKARKSNTKYAVRGDC